MADFHDEIDALAYDIEVQIQANEKSLGEIRDSEPEQDYVDQIEIPDPAELFSGDD